MFASLSHTHYWYEVGMLKVGCTRAINRDRDTVPGVYNTRLGRVVFCGPVDMYFSDKNLKGSPLRRHNLIFLYNRRIYIYAYGVLYVQ